MNRKIIHIDMDAFFASVEQRDHPRLRGRPIAVGGSQKRGVVAAASYEARKFGVRSAMPGAKALRLCPQLIFVKSRFDVYRQVSHTIRSIFHEYTDLVEPLSLDEAFLDVTENKKGIPSATWVAEAIRRDILKATKLTASAGVSYCKFLAKVASDINKPNGSFVIPPSQAEPFLNNLPIGKFFGVGKVTEKQMHSLGIFKGEDLKTWSEFDLAKHFGKSGPYYFRIVRGIDNRPVEPDHIRKSVGVENTFREDLETMAEAEQALFDLAEELERRLRKADTAGKTITIKCRYENFDTITRAQSQKRFVDDARSLFEVGRFLLGQTQAGKRGVRLLGLTVSNLNNQEDPDTEIQLTLPFGESMF
jgi:DNA polymerase-4